jgi:hypothetical protein
MCGECFKEAVTVLSPLFVCHLSQYTGQPHAMSFITPQQLK